VPKKKSRAGLVVALLLLTVAGGAIAWARPWGRTLDVPALVAGVESGAIPRAWVTENGIEGGIRLLPVAAASELLMPFTASLPEGQVTETVDRLRSAGAAVDASWEVWRLRGLAVEAQGRGRYYGLEGGDVLTYAQRLAALDPGNAEAASLLLKVGERMAWDAEAAMTDGAPDEASGLVQTCLDLVPDHPRCLEVSRSEP